jgi:hypothetical protein
MVDEEQPQQEQAGETLTFHGHGFALGVPGTFAGERVTLSTDGTRVLTRTPLIVEGTLAQEATEEALPPVPVASVPPDTERKRPVRTPTNVPPGTVA